MTPEFKLIAQNFDSQHDEQEDEIELIRNEGARSTNSFRITLNLGSIIGFAYMQFPKWKRKQLIEQLKFSSSNQQPARQQELANSSRVNQKQMDHLNEYHKQLFYERYSQEINAYALRYYTPFKINGAAISCPVWNGFFITVCAYLTLKFLLLSITYTQYDTLTKLWHPDFSGANQSQYTDECFLRSALNPSDSRHLERFEQVTWLFTLLGAPTIGPNELMAYFVLVTGFIIVIAVSFPMFNPNNPNFRLNVVNFLMQPFEERQRIRAKFLDAYRDILVDKKGEPAGAKANGDVHQESFMKYGLDPRDQVKIQQLDPSGKHNLNENLMDGTYLAYFVNWLNEFICRPTRDKMRAQSSMDKSLFGADLQYQNQKDQSSDLIDRYNSMRNNFRSYPAYLRYASYVRLAKIARYHIYSLMLGLAVVAITLFVLFFIDESHHRIARRLEERHCRRWNEQALPLRLIKSLNPFPDPQLGELLYGQYNASSLWSQIKIGASVEFPASFKLPVIMMSIESGLTVGVLSFWVGLYSGIMRLNHVALCTWVQQLQDQLRQTNLMLDELIKLEIGLSQMKKPSEQASLPQNQNALTKNEKTYTKAAVRQARAQIERVLCASYVNYSIFRREFRYYGPYFKFLTLQIVIYVGFNLLLALSILSVKSLINRIVIWSVTLFGILILNVTVYMSVDFINRVQILFRCMNILMAKSTQVSMESSSRIINLWRRQLMSSGEICKTFGVVILGVELSVSNFVQFNSYVLGASIYFLKSS